LGGVDRGRVAKTGGGLDVVGGQPDIEPAAVLSDFEVAVSADSGDGPAVAVFTQSVAVRRSRRSFVRVMITSPTLA
jgi:hypothetical protein